MRRTIKTIGVTETNALLVHPQVLYEVFREINSQVLQHDGRAKPRGFNSTTIYSRPNGNLYSWKLRIGLLQMNN
jgi:hypothetical protein